MKLRDTEWWILKLVRLYGYRCHYCKERMDTTKRGRQYPHALTATLDHKVPVSKGGKKELCNLVLACRECNQEKANGEYNIFQKLKYKERQARKKHSISK